jgi:hypothetical protein
MYAYGVTKFIREIREAGQSLIPSSHSSTTIEQTARIVFERFSERLKKLLNGREERGLKLALGGHVNHKSHRIFSVRSENNQHAYLVDLERKTCTCPDCQKGHICKHRIAAYLIEQSNIASKPNSTQDRSYSEDEGNRGDEKLDITRAVLNARSQFLREAIIYAKIPHGGDRLNVEVISLNGETATVRALPIIKNDTLLVPQFPFQEGQSSASIVLASSLLDITIYR